MKSRLTQLLFMLAGGLTPFASTSAFAQSIPIAIPDFPPPAEITSPYIQFAHVGPSDGNMPKLVLVAEAKPPGSDRSFFFAEVIVVPRIHLNGICSLVEAVCEHERWPVYTGGCDFEVGAFSLTTSGIGAVAKKSPWRLSRIQAEGLFRRLAALAKTENMSPALQDALERNLSFVTDFEQPADLELRSKIAPEVVSAPAAANSKPGTAEEAH